MRGGDKDMHNTAYIVIVLVYIFIGISAVRETNRVLSGLNHKICDLLVVLLVLMKQHDSFNFLLRLSL
jgi:hypothetical protein